MLTTEDFKKDMQEAEDALLQSGFSNKQWPLIRQYIIAAVKCGQSEIATAAYEAAEQAKASELKPL